MSDDPMPRSKDEIQRAHDILVAILVGDLAAPEGMCPRQLNVAAGTLCWVLRHDHNKGFANALAEIEAHAASLGFVLERTGRVQ